MKEQVDLAIEFDRLVGLPGWEKVLRHAAAEVNDEIAEVTKHPYAPEIQRIGVIRWDAKRALLDSIIGYIESTQRERDRIVKELQDGGSSNPAGN
jgi:hypothetical protein